MKKYNNLDKLCLSYIAMQFEYLFAEPWRYLVITLNKLLIFTPMILNF